MTIQPEQLELVPAIADPELQPFLARDALALLDELLTLIDPTETVSAGQMGAMIRLMRQASA